MASRGNRPDKIRGRRRRRRTPDWIVALLITLVTAGTAAAVTYIFLGPPTPPKTQVIAGMTIDLIGVEPNPLYGNLYDWDYWYVVIVENTYNVTEAARPLVTIAGLTSCSHVVLQISLNNATWSAPLTSTGNCVYDPGSAYNRGVAANTIGDTWFFEHKYEDLTSEYGSSISFTAQMIQ
jgi:hypothetical protein